MSEPAAKLLDQIHRLRVNRAGDRRAPHKPLLLLYALGQLRRGQRAVGFPEVESALHPLLDAYAPPVKGRHSPQLPYWHLMSDGLWEVQDAAELERQAGGFPTMNALRGSQAGLTPEVATQLVENPRLFEQVVATLLEEHFPPTTHDDILHAVGLENAGYESTEEPERDKGSLRRRDPEFRETVLRAYEHRCAFSGFRASLGGTYFGCEAAHVQWHAYDGPDVLANGIALEPTVHKLFDVGAWSLTDDRRIVVSAQFTEADENVDRIRGRHGQQLKSPLPGTPELNTEFIRWHREPDLGGVFREPALPL